MKKKLALFLSVVLLTTSLCVNGFADTKGQASFDVPQTIVYSGTKDATIDDIVITESEAGALKGGMNIYLQAENLQLEKGAEFEVISGDIRIDSVKVDKDIIKIAIKKSSMKEASVIKIKGLKLFVPEDVPEGGYDLYLITEESDQFKNNQFGMSYDKDANGYKFDTAYVKIKDDFLKVEVPEEIKLSDVSDERYSVEMTGEDGGYISDGHVMIPVRTVVDALSMGRGIVNWNDETKEITVALGARISKIVVGSKTANINGVEFSLASPIEMKDGKVYMEYKDLGYIMGYNLNKINWNEESKLVTFGY